MTLRKYINVRVQRRIAMVPFRALFLALAAHLVTVSEALDNGAARTPVLGFSAWNEFRSLHVVLLKNWKEYTIPDPIRPSGLPQDELQHLADYANC